jgi:hypothetical protein
VRWCIDRRSGFSCHTVFVNEVWAGNEKEADFDVALPALMTGLEAFATVYHSCENEKVES